VANRRSNGDYELPRNFDAERALLGAILLDNANYSGVQGELDLEDFYSKAHQVIFGRMAIMIGGQQPIDLVTLVDELELNRELDTAGGVPAVSALTDGIPRMLNLQQYAAIIKEKSRLRKLAKLGNGLEERALSPGASAKDIVRRLQEHTEAFSSAIENDDPEKIRKWTDVPGLQEIPEAQITWLVPGLIPRGAVVLIAGEAGSCKTWLAMSLSKAVSSGTAFPGRECMRSPVLYLDKENPPSVWRERSALLAIESNENLRVWGGWCEQAVPLIGDRLIKKFAEGQNPLVIFDSFIRFHSADENSAGEMATVMGQLRVLANAGATVLILHHRAKSEASKYRGSSDIQAAVDLAYTIEKAKDGDLDLRCFKNRVGPEFSITLRLALDKPGGFVMTENDDQAQARELHNLLRDHQGKSRDFPASHRAEKREAEGASACRS
jgi:hypothetical protein